MVCSECSWSKLYKLYKYVGVENWRCIFSSLMTVFVVDTGFHVFVWVGKEATAHEKGGGLMIAHVSNGCRKSAILLCSHCVTLSHTQEYVKKSKHPFLPITRVAQGQHNLQFEATFDEDVPVSVF